MTSDHATNLKARLLDTDWLIVINDHPCPFMLAGYVVVAKALEITDKQSDGCCMVDEQGEAHTGLIFWNLSADIRDRYLQMAKPRIWVTPKHAVWLNIQLDPLLDKIRVGDPMEPEFRKNCFTITTNAPKLHSAVTSVIETTMGEESINQFLQASKQSVVAVHIPFNRKD